MIERKYTIFRRMRRVNIKKYVDVSTKVYDAWNPNFKFKHKFQ